MNLSEKFIDESDRVYVGFNARSDIREMLIKLYKTKRFLSACDNCNGRITQPRLLRRRYRLVKSLKYRLLLSVELSPNAVESTPYYLVVCS